MESNRLAITLFAVFVAVVFIFLISPSVTATLTANQANGTPATGFAVLVAIWIFPVILIGGAIAFFAFQAIKGSHSEA